MKMSRISMQTPHICIWMTLCYLVVPPCLAFLLHKAFVWINQTHCLTDLKLTAFPPVFHFFLLLSHLYPANYVVYYQCLIYVCIWHIVGEYLHMMFVTGPYYIATMSLRNCREESWLACWSINRSLGPKIIHTKSSQNSRPFFFSFNRAYFIYVCVYL